MKTTVHTLDTAPEASRPLLEASRRAFGRLPSLHGVMAESPGLLEGYQTLHRLAIEGTAFTPAERTVVWMAVNVRHACHYCVPAHTAIAHREGIDPGVITALRDETPLPDPKLEALRTFALAVVDTRGRPLGRRGRGLRGGRLRRARCARRGSDRGAEGDVELRQLDVRHPHRRVVREAPLAAQGGARRLRGHGDETPLPIPGLSRARHRTLLRERAASRAQSREPSAGNQVEVAGSRHRHVVE